VVFLRHLQIFLLHHRQVCLRHLLQEVWFRHLLPLVYHRHPSTCHHLLLDFLLLQLLLYRLRLYRASRNLPRLVTTTDNSSSSNRRRHMALLLLINSLDKSNQDKKQLLGTLTHIMDMMLTVPAA
jgi:hypothetical protein